VAGSVCGLEARGPGSPCLGYDILQERTGTVEHWDRRLPACTQSLPFREPY